MMLPLSVAIRQELDDILVPRRRAERPSSRRCSAALGVGVGAVLLATVAHGAPNPLWPPGPAVSTESLADSAYWPSDSAYGYESKVSSGYRESAGQWWLYSFVPKRTTVVLRQDKLPAGLSVDAAWRYTQGTPGVILAFLDDGIDLTSPDLVEGLYLNVGELKQRPPTHADGSNCGPLDLPDSPLMDCSDPPDGVLTIADYREMLAWLSGSTGLDPNGNGRLDPQDLLLLNCADPPHFCLADGIDNDGNGLVDDIAGWDFVDFDNSPFPTFTSSGTEAALDATARTNNDLDRAGVCPNCRALPIRVGYQRGASPPATALGLLYASSLGATAALVGHLPQGRSQILDAALKTAAQRNLLTLLVHDGEQQRSLAQHFNSDAVRVIGTLTQLIVAPSTTTTTTPSFVAPDPCQTFEPGPVLFSAAPACSRRGPAIALGIAGLTAAARRATSSAARPTALELGAILAHSTDAIDPSWAIEATESPSLDTPILRLNANQAVAEALDDIVPPEIELERPAWHETIVVGGLSVQQLSVVGRISAARAGSYDVFVELGAGKSPGDNFRVIAPPQTGIPAGTPIGGGSSLAKLNPSPYLPSLPEGATGQIATLRVRVVAHPAPTDERGHADIETEVRREVVIIDDETLMPGFPYALNATPTAPRIVDLDHDDHGAAEIVVGTIDGRLLALSQQDGSVKDAFKSQVRTQLLPAFRQLVETAKPAPPPLFAGTPSVSAELGQEPITGPTAIADLTGDARPELVFTTSNGRVYMVGHDGSPREGWPRCVASKKAVDCSTGGADNAFQTAPPVLVDIDGDRRNEIVVAARDGKVYAFESNGADVDGWPIQLETPNGSPAQLTAESPAVGDMNGDQVADLVLSIGEPRDPADPYATWYVTILGAVAPKGPSIAADWPIATTSYDFLVDRQTRMSPPPSIDTGASGRASRALLYGNAHANVKDPAYPNADATGPFFLPIAPGTISAITKLPRHAEPAHDQSGTQGFSLSATGADSTVTDHRGIAPLYARPVLGDLDRDGNVDLVLPATTVGTIYSLLNTDIEKNEHRSLLAFWNGATGKMLPASPLALGDLVGTVAPIVADLTNDGYPEIITPDGAGALVAYDACGRSPEGWPKILGGSMSQSPAVGDVDGDGLLEVVAVTDDGRIFAWNTEGTVGSFVPWGTALHDNLNQSAHYDTAPEHVQPLPLTPSGGCLLSDASPNEDESTKVLSARGGCSCSVPQSAAPGRGWFAPMLTLVSVFVAARKRRRTRPSR